jgi:transcription antitermination protein NusB
MRDRDLIQAFAPGAEPVGEATDAHPLEGRRRLARVALIQVLYQSAMTRMQISAVAKQFEEHRLGETIDGLALNVDLAFFSRLTIGIASEAEALTLLVQEALEKRQFGRLEYVLQAILIAGAYELRAFTDVPPRSTIDEYTDIAAAFFDKGERSLVNAVLDRLAHGMRPNDFTAPADP